MPYRDDREALSLQVAELERENEELKEQIDDLRAEAKRQRDEDRNVRQSGALKACVICGGSLLPVAVFAGRENNPVPLSLSTLRFGSPRGGFTHSAPIKALVCSSCGFIHSFIDIGATAGARVTEDFQTAGSKPAPPPGESGTFPPSESGSRRVGESGSSSKTEPND